MNAYLIRTRDNADHVVHADSAVYAIRVFLASYAARVGEYTFSDVVSSQRVAEAWT